MSAESYYTTNKQQMGPVSWDELRELADSGILEPNDLVWTEGMNEWVKANRQSGLIASEGTAEKATAKRSSFTKNQPERRKRRDNDEEEEEEDKRRSRQRQHDRARMAVGVKVGLILTAAACLLLLLGCAGVLLVYWSFTAKGGGGGVGGPRVEDFTIFNLHAGQFSERRFRFQQGNRIIITATSNVQFPRTDVDLFVFQGVGGAILVAQDTTIGPNSRVEFVAPVTDTYRIVVQNHGPGQAHSCRVSIEQP